MCAGQVSDVTTGCLGCSRACILVDGGYPWGPEGSGVGVRVYGYSCCILGFLEWNGYIILRHTVVMSRV